MINTIRILALFVLLIGCTNDARYVDEKRSFLIDSVAYYPVGYPSVANLDPRWVAYTSFGKFTYHHAVKVGDSVTVIFRKRDTAVFDPIIEHSEIKDNDTLR